MQELVALTREGNVGIITVNNPPVNALSPGVPAGIRKALQALQEDVTIEAVVLIGGGRTFIAGADINEFGKITSGQKKADIGLHSLLQALEDCPKPVVAAIHGTAFGGGLETAMACHYRVAVPTAQVGQPEVKLGLIPGAGGTQRLPRLAGVAKAVEMCAFGEPVKAAEAVELGIADRLIEGDLLSGAIAFAREIANQPAPRTRERNAKLHDASSAIFDQARRHASKVRRGQTAPLAAIEAVHAATQLDFEKSCARAAELFNECLFSNQAKALIHVFFGERTVSKIPGIPKEIKPGEIQRAAVIGAGTMGGGIAMTYANAGIPVIVKDTTEEALHHGLETIRNNYARTVSRGRLTQAAMDQRLALITPQLNYDAFGQADIVVEAVFENMSVKKQVFSEIDKIAKPSCILASNTSSLDIDEIASATSRPEM